MNDPYVDPASGLLRNRAGITDRGQLARVESAISVVAMYALETETLPGRFDLPHLQAFHRRIFGRVYPWGG